MEEEKKKLNERLELSAKLQANIKDEAEAIENYIGLLKDVCNTTLNEEISDFITGTISEIIKDELDH